MTATSARQTIIYQPVPRAVVSQTQILVTAINGRAASSGALFEQFWAGFCQKDARSAVALALIMSRIIAAVCSGDGPLIRPQLAARLANLSSYRHISGVPLFCRALTATACPMSLSQLCSQSDPFLQEQPQRDSHDAFARHTAEVGPSAVS